MIVSRGGQAETSQAAAPNSITAGGKESPDDTGGLPGRSSWLIGGGASITTRTTISSPMSNRVVSKSSFQGGGRRLERPSVAINYRRRMTSVPLVPLAMYYVRKDILRARASGLPRPEPEISIYMAIFASPTISASLLWMARDARPSISP
ncbi:hypothetical protein N7510_003551 [Penicillium lagena]|uniref:uncharacterized protein n=1 Tax=Penicillium lagena TaxID=94218 RepID=UPI0025414BBD|nr:uncharacterized protein N7510_003551 [Penicillium lagena]KAJ5619567.1 hypothetical protein N7510_003551 [Penicillium lagena]